MVSDRQEVKAGDILVKIPRAASSKAGDITGGLPRVTELFEARNPSNPAIVAEINGDVQMGKIKRGNREIIIKSRRGDIEKHYLVPTTKQILVQENDYVKAGDALELVNLRAAVEGDGKVVVKAGAKTFTATATLSARERHVLLCGGLLASL